jgi:hypothetical protein
VVINVLKVRPLYRHSEFLRKEREKGRRSPRETWYKGKDLGSQNVAVLIINLTPAGQMTMDMNKVCSEFNNIAHGLGIIIVKRAGKNWPCSAGLTN